MSRSRITLDVLDRDAFFHFKVKKLGIDITGTRVGPNNCDELTFEGEDHAIRQMCKELFDDESLFSECNEIIEQCDIMKLKEITMKTKYWVEKNEQVINPTDLNQYIKQELMKRSKEELIERLVETENTMEWEVAFKEELEDLGSWNITYKLSQEGKKLVITALLDNNIDFIVHDVDNSREIRVSMQQGTNCEVFDFDKFDYKKFEEILNKKINNKKVKDMFKI